MKLICKKYAVYLDNDSDDWIKNLKLGIKPLIADGVIDELWIEKLIQTTNKLGPYFVFSDLLAMPHISPDSSTKKLATGFIYCKKPLKFFGNGYEKTCQIIVPLVTTDANSHMELLAQLVSLWNDQDFIKKLTSISDQNLLTVL
ncbi:pentitol phosphotransferase enzyme II [Spiroplasma clarkii]|uniref:PTS sugar transporter subunit IIA n=1 Tax=Spiroplasma clarkii TaxID=2139 RepID=UPI000B56D33A|nr:PTS sugar transporter subunit IIA [Spiroplasma clarkii]ARU91704.1 pentitol phosphotransferase enzyme II [Spiroplasma clarkii]